MDEVKKTEIHAASASAFVEGGIQDSCDDGCSICLEDFSDSDPSTMTTCKHEFHLQCILEWCQRSSNCPMCWRPISLKNPASQELLVAVEHERSLRFTPSRNATIFHHPMLGDFELQNLPVGANDHELEERIMQHLAAAAAMRRSHHIARWDSSRSHSSAPTNVINPSPLLMSSSAQTNQVSASSYGSPDDNRSYWSESSSHNIDTAGPSDFQSLSDTWRSRFNSMSMKYKESISRSTRGWKEKLFSRSSSMADIGSEVRREINAGIATVARMMERLETRNNNRAGQVSPANLVDPSVMGLNNRDDRDTHCETQSNGGTTTSSAS